MPRRLKDPALAVFARVHSNGRRAALIHRFWPFPRARWGFSDRAQTLHGDGRAHSLYLPGHATRWLLSGADQPEMGPGMGPRRSAKRLLRRDLASRTCWNGLRRSPRLTAPMFRRREFD